MALTDLFGADVEDFLERTVKGDRTAEVLFEESKMLNFFCGTCKAYKCVDKFGEVL